MTAVIFDLDGVLVHTDHLHYQAWKQLADRLGIPFDREINNRLRGVSRLESLEIILEGYGGPPLDEGAKRALAEEKNEHYRALLADLTPDDVRPAVRLALRQLRERGHRTAIGSSSKNAGFILERTGLLDLFDAVSDGNNIARSKPDPEVFLKAAEYLNAAPETCTVVEDAVAGIDAAAAAGMTAIAVGDAAGYRRADYVLQEFGELPQIVEAIDRSIRTQ